MLESESLPWEQVGHKYRKSYKRAGMLVDLDRCIGCHSCSVSCKAENDVPLGNFRMRVRYLEQPDDKGIAFTPLICIHCVDAPCLKACPSKAIRREKDGRVYVDESRCDLEKECVEACPYGAISINVEKEVAEKCDFCQHRTDLKSNLFSPCLIIPGVPFSSSAPLSWRAAFLPLLCTPKT